ncbi:MarR family winged helix-turn-helix transcriptional regulator [Gordonia sp. (in: high G+C Gram-positive bacteria)]|uniref:MarR family winged helix-turn-helix transcriptional regulator n=1 Tax=Gordonia sp. (in: high G+C Gram-positive bacteria) TaxID=84139 RepID=UPI0039E44E7B
MPVTDDAVMPFLLISAFRRLVDAVHADLANEGFPGVRATHGFAMQAVGEGCSGVELAARLGVSKQAAAKQAAALEDLGFITRGPSPTDRRERLLTPTPRGREMLRLSADGFRREVAAWRGRVGDGAVDATLRALAGVADGRSAVDLSFWS